MSMVPLLARRLKCGKLRGGATASGVVYSQREAMGWPYEGELPLPRRALLSPVQVISVLDTRDDGIEIRWEPVFIARKVRH